jgi:RNA polymerase sigma factor (sigma-70 family)
MSIAEDFVPLARKLAWDATRRYGTDFPDAYSDALYGLVRAARRADPDRPFASYATYTIRGAILQGIRDRWGWRRGTPRPQLVSLDDPHRGEHGDETLSETIADESAVSPYEAAENARLWRQVDALPAKQRSAVRLHYQWSLSQSEIAGLLGVSQMQVSRYLSQARSRLARGLRPMPSI